jgi:hypothetical protein
MRRSQILVASLFLLTACPSDPDEATAPSEGVPPVSAQPGGGTTTAADAKVGEPGPSAAALLQHKQGDLAGQPNTVTLSGELKCIDGSGPFWVHVFPPPDDPNNPDAEIKEGDTPPGPITGMEIEAPGAFSIVAPKGGEAMVLAFEDVDKDGFPGAQEPVFFFEDRRSVSLEADRSGLSLACFKLMAPAPDEIGPPPGGGQTLDGAPPGMPGTPGKGQKGKGQKGKGKQPPTGQ